jgi:hypothetical protein
MRLAVSALAIAGLLAVGCGGGGDNADNAAPDEEDVSATDSGDSSGSGDSASTDDPVEDVDPSEHVTLSDETVVISGGPDVVTSISDDHAVYTLDGDSEGVSDLEPGDVMLITGVDAGRVTGVEDDGGDVAVTIEPVQITDVITEGTISWDGAPPDESTALAFAGSPTVEDATEPNSVSSGIRPSAVAPGGASGELAAGPMLGFHAAAGGDEEEDEEEGDEEESESEVEISATVQGWEVSLSPSVEDGAVELTLHATKGLGGTADEEGEDEGGAESETGSLEMGVEVKVHAENLDPSGEISISGGEIEHAEMQTPLDGYAEASASASTPEAAQFPQSILIRVPIAYEWPVYIYGIPFYISVQANFSIQPSLSTEESGIEEGFRIEYDGESGFTFDDGEGTPTGDQVTIDEPENPLPEVTATPSPGALAMVFAVQAPRVGIGIGTTSFLGEAKAGVYVDVINSFGLTVAPGTSPLPCRSMVWDAATHGGGEFKIAIGETEVGAENAIELSKASHTWIAPEIQGCEP